MTHTRLDGSTVIVESRHIVLRDENNQPMAILEINRDMTERHRKAEAEQAVHKAQVPSSSCHSLSSAFAAGAEHRNELLTTVTEESFDWL